MFGFVYEECRINSLFTGTLKRILLDDIEESFAEYFNKIMLF